MAAAKKLTKKMLERLDRAELRRIAVLGMGMNPRDAYSLDFKGIVSWVHDRSEAFSEVNIQEIGETEFRDGVAFYVIELQNFIKGGDNPTWPPANVEVPKKKRGPSTKEERESLASTNKEENVVPLKSKTAAPKEVAKVEKEVTPTVKKRTKSEAVVPGVLEAVQASVATKPVKKSKLKKVSLKQKVGASSSEATENAAVLKIAEDIKSLCEENKAEIRAMSEAMDKSLEAYREGMEAIRVEINRSSTLLGNALLYIANSAIQDDGEEFSKIGEVPDPKDYLN